MLLAGEGRGDRPAFLSESLGEVHGRSCPGAAAPRRTYCIRGDGPSTQQPPTGGTFKRMDRIQGRLCVQLFLQQIS